MDRGRNAAHYRRARTAGVLVATFQNARRLQDVDDVPECLCDNPKCGEAAEVFHVERNGPGHTRRSFCAAHWIWHVGIAAHGTRAQFTALYGDVDKGLYITTNDQIERIFEERLIEGDI